MSQLREYVKYADLLSRMLLMSPNEAVIFAVFFFSSGDINSLNLTRSRSSHPFTERAMKEH